MIPKEKAIELVDKFYQTTPNEYFVNEPIGIAGRYKSWEQSKKCALIAVDELIKYHDDLMDVVRYELPSNIVAVIPYKYWDDVKKEIERL